MSNLLAKDHSSELAGSCAESCDININESERMVSKVAGGALLLYGLSRFSLGTLLVAVAGGALIYRGMTGHCHLYDALGTSSADEG